jgi:hypothetical protein
MYPYISCWTSSLAIPYSFISLLARIFHAIYYGSREARVDAAPKLEVFLGQ